MTKPKASPVARRPGDRLSRTSRPDAPPQDGLPPDAVAMLMADHKRVKKLFAEFDSLTDEGSDNDKSAVVATICQELIIHTMLEEEIFYPAVRKAIEEDDLMDEALVEHAGAKELISQLQAAQPNDDLYDAKVTVLGEQIAHHVTEEEGSMFPQATHVGLDLAGLGGQMLARKSALLGQAPLSALPGRSISGPAAGGDEDEFEKATTPNPKSTVGDKSRAPKNKTKPASKSKKR